jgi:hypothetical protein
MKEIDTARLTFSLLIFLRGEKLPESSQKTIFFNHLHKKDKIMRPTKIIFASNSLYNIIYKPVVWSLYKSQVKLQIFPSGG